MSIDSPVNNTKRWIRDFVIRYTLCPFAADVFTNNKILFTRESSKSQHDLLIAFWNTLNSLEQSPSYSTAILILENGPVDFDDYLDLFYKAELMLEESTKNEEFQLAGFHPNYIFENTGSNDPGNYTNRSPYPLIHILYVEDVSNAIESHPDISAVPEKNIETLENLGLKQLKGLFESFKSSRF